MLPLISPIVLTLLRNSTFCCFSCSCSFFRRAACSGGEKWQHEARGGSMGGESLEGFFIGGLVSTGRYQAGKVGLLFIQQAFINIYSIT